MIVKGQKRTKNPAPEWGEDWPMFVEDKPMTLRFHQTCFACPEQYDVFDGEKKVAYLRLRHGLFYAACPDVGGEVVYQAEIGEDGWTGCFEDEAQRVMHLKLAEAAILDWLERQNV